MAALVLLNGPPASGKSTVARRLVESRPLALDLDVDIVRGLLGAWAEQPLVAGQAARGLATAMASVHLGEGRDVIVPQFVGRLPFVEKLEALAAARGADFAHLVLDISRAEAVDAFATRHRAGEHPDATVLVARSDAADPVGEMYDALQQLVGTRPTARRVRAARGDVDGTVAEVVGALAALGIDW